ncbi:MAG: hypothetical protein ABJE47_04660 [bacterium]
MRVVRGIALAIVLVSASACIDATRVNDTCTWSDPVAGALDRRRSRDRDHLRQDAQIAWELSVRYSDTRYRHAPALARPLRRECRQAVEDTIRARHAVTAQDIRTATVSREWWIDVVAVFLPMLGLAVVGTDALMRRARGAFDGERRVRMLVATLLLVAAIALAVAGVTQYWAMIVESIRLRDEHVADRGTVLPSAVHAGLTMGVSFLVCLVPAMARFRRREPRGSALKL